MKIIYFIIALAVLMSASQASALRTYCIDNETLMMNITVDGDVIQLPDYCRYGCGEGTSPYGDECFQSPIAVYSSGFIIIMVFIFLMFTIPYKLKQKKGKR